MVSRSLVLGYHGCDQGLLDSVLLGKQDLKPSQNDYDWLGHGVYFFEDSANRALAWAGISTQSKRSRIRTPAVIGAVIDLGNCLNLADTEHLSLVKKAHEGAQALYDGDLSALPKNRGLQRCLDCEVMRLLHFHRENTGHRPFDTVRGFFIEGQPLYENSGFRELDHVQICVRNHKCILGYFLPRNSR